MTGIRRALTARGMSTAALPPTLTLQNIGATNVIFGGPGTNWFITSKFDVVKR